MLSLLVESSASKLKVNECIMCRPRVACGDLVSHCRCRLIGSCCFVDADNIRFYFANNTAEIITTTTLVGLVVVVVVEY